eukprot:PITA_14697
MKLTTWNIRGLGSRRKQRNLSNRITKEKLDIIFVQETKCSMEKIREIHNKWLIKYEYLEVKANNSAGGILTLWDPKKFGILDAEASRNYLSLVYSLVGGTGQLGRDSKAFQDFIMNMGLVDTEIINGTFTWNNKRGEASQVASKLDRFIVSEDLLLTGPAITVSILPFGGLDHWPVHLKATFMGTLRNRPFRFENACLSHPKFTSNIDKWWKEDLNIQGTKMYMHQQRLKYIKSKLKACNKKEFGNILKARIETEQKL